MKQQTHGFHSFSRVRESSLACAETGAEACKGIPLSSSACWESLGSICVPVQRCLLTTHWTLQHPLHLTAVIRKDKPGLTALLKHRRKTRTILNFCQEKSEETRQF